jgi:hypothetical protein
MKLCVRVAAFLFLMPLVAGAASPVDGMWAGRMDSDEDAALTLFTIKTDDAARLTGTVTGAGFALAIEDGAISNDTLTFTASNPSLAFSCSGTLKDDEITMTCQVSGQGAKSFVVKRQKAT